MPSDPIAFRLTVIVALLAGILGTLLVVVWSQYGFTNLVVAVAGGSILAWLAAGAAGGEF